MKRDNRMKKLTIMALVIGLAMLLSTPVFAYELGIAWINDYPGAGNDLDYCDDNAIGFKNELSWYSVDYEESDGDVLESHFTDDGYSLDKPDVSFQCGHSITHDGHKAIYLNPDSGNQYVEWDEADFGDYDLEWFGTVACYLLNSDDDNYWIHATDGGLHLFCGFKTTQAQSPSNLMGKKWGQYLDDGEKVKNAWFHACDVTQTSSKQVNVITYDDDCYDDYIHGKGGPACSDPTPQATFWTWSHTC
ncbi:hypothetical protein CW713_06185 [Methanophagales archaeon]|nr:MAG: hypothetical protein CW714_06945 [Methanophagales archaeon]RJS81531.1 MAG: hypothetical protein CW713_06185 [Methanophagales archaeon]